MSRQPHDFAKHLDSRVVFVPSSRDAVFMKLSLCGVLRHFGLELGQVSKSCWETRVRESIAGNAMLEAAAEPILRARAALRGELAGLEKLLCNLARQEGRLPYRVSFTSLTNSGICRNLASPEVSQKTPSSPRKPAFLSR